MAIVDQYGNGITSSRKLLNAANRHDRGIPWQPDFAKDIDELFPQIVAITVMRRVCMCDRIAHGKYLNLILPQSRPGVSKSTTKAKEWLRKAHAGKNESCKKAVKKFWDENKLGK